MIAYFFLRRSNSSSLLCGALPDTGAPATLVRLLLLGRPVSADEARDALQPLALADARRLVDVVAGVARARVELRPYADDTGEPWWVVSDFGADVRPGPLA